MSETQLTITVSRLGDSYSPYGRYRVYVDHELITERSWIWGVDTKIEENICLMLDKGIIHNIRIEPIFLIFNSSKIDNVIYPILDDTFDEIIENHRNNAVKFSFSDLLINGRKTGYCKETTNLDFFI